MGVKAWAVLPLALHTLGTSAQSLPTEILINPKATYLRTSSDPATDAPPINLSTYGILPGDLLRLTQLGDFNTGIGIFVGNMIGIFSSNSVLLAQSETNRVPGAIASGPPVFTGPTYFGGLPTDIPLDFQILQTNISLHVPAGAAYLFVSAADSLFYDNTDDAANHFRVRIERGTETVLTATNLSAGSVDIAWNTDSNQWYQVQTAPSLSNAWTDVGSPILGTGVSSSITNSTFGQPVLFYRVKRVP